MGALFAYAQAHIEGPAGSFVVAATATDTVLFYGEGESVALRSIEGGNRRWTLIDDTGATWTVRRIGGCGGCSAR